MTIKSLTYFLIFIISFLSLNAYSQSMIVYDEDRNIDIEFKYNTYESDNSLPNLFINELSTSQSRMRSFFKYSISAKVKNQLIKEGNTYNLKIRIDSISVDGNFDFRGFNFQKAVLPAQLYYSYNIYENNSKTLQERKIYLNIFYSEPYIIDSSFTDISDTKSFTITNEKLNYVYNKEQKDVFNKSIEYIKQYYNDGKSIEEINNNIVKLNPDNIDKIILESIDIKYISKKFNKIKLPIYQEQLSLQETDPAGIYKNYTTTKFRIDSLYKLYITRFKVLDSLYYAKGMQYKNDSNTIKSIEYFDKSIDFSPEYLPSLYELAYYEYNNEEYFNSESYLNRILLITSKYNDANVLALRNYNAMLQQGIELNRQERYTEGLRLLEHAKKFCTTNMHVMQCDSIQDISIEQAQAGIYKSYISIAAASMRRGRFDMTESYLESATKYQQKFSHAIKYNSEAERIYTLLITQYLRLSIEAANNYNNRQANNYINHADSLANAHSLDEALSFVEQTKIQIKDKDYSKSVATAENIKNIELIEKNQYSNVQIEEISPVQIAKNSYELYIRKGDEYDKHELYSKAYAQYKEAENIANDYDLKKDKDLDYKIHKNARFAILENLNTASLHAWASRFKSADNILNNTLVEIKENKLEEDTFIIRKIKHLRIEILKKADSKQSIVFNNKMQKARKSIDFNDFINMKLYCDSAITIGENSYQIPLNIGYPRTLLLKYSKEIEYQILVESIKQQLDSNNYKTAIEDYNISITEYKSLNNRIDKFTLKDFAKYANNSIVFDYTITTAIDSNKTELAFDIWKLAIETGSIIDDKTAELCMFSLADIDHNNYPNSNSKALYNNRFGKTKAFKKYKKYYYKGLKK